MFRKNAFFGVSTKNNFVPPTCPLQLLLQRRKIQRLCNKTELRMMNYTFFDKRMIFCQQRGLA